MLNLKINPELPHHYIFAVLTKNNILSLKYGPSYFSNDDIQKVKDALSLMDDEIYKNIYNMSPSEIYDMFDCSHTVMTLVGFKLIYQSKLAEIYHFSYKNKLSEPKDFFDNYVKRANSSKVEMEGLKNARI
jgi:hypothetical protein